MTTRSACPCVLNNFHDAEGAMIEISNDQKVEKIGHCPKMDKIFWKNEVFVLGMLKIVPLMYLPPCINLPNHLNYYLAI